MPRTYARTLGHGPRNRLGHGAVLLDQPERHGQFVGLGVVGVDHIAALEDVGPPLHVGQDRGDQPAGTALGGGEGDAVVVGGAQHPVDRGFDIVRQGRA
jgi:hypothetical protein